MFKNTYQSGFLSILYSIGSKPLQIWDKQSTFRATQFTMGTSNDLPIRIFNPQYSKSWALTSPLPSSPALSRKSKHSASSCPSSSWSSKMYAPPHSAQKIFHLRGSGPRRQERPQEVQSIQLPVHHQGQALHLHYAYEAGRGLEPDPVQPFRLHQEGIRQQLHRDPEGDNPRQL